MNALLKVLFLTFGSGCNPLRIGLRGMGNALCVSVTGVQLVSKILNIKVANLHAGHSDKGAMDRQLFFQELMMLEEHSLSSISAWLTKF